MNVSQSAPAWAEEWCGVGPDGYWSEAGEAGTYTEIGRAAAGVASNLSYLGIWGLAMEVYQEGYTYGQWTIASASITQTFATPVAIMMDQGRQHPAYGDYDYRITLGPYAWDNCTDLTCLSLSATLPAGTYDLSLWGALHGPGMLSMTSIIQITELPPEPPQPPATVPDRPGPWPLIAISAVCLFRSFAPHLRRAS